MAYDVLILPSALRDIDDLPRAVRGRVMVKISSLAQDPRPPGVKKLKGSDDLYRVRVGDYRIIYRIDEKGRCVVLVIRVSRRDQAY